MKQEKKMKDAFAEIEDMFHAIPEWDRVFKQYERDIRYYNRFEWNRITTTERLIEKRDALLQTAKALDNRDLLILYYIRNIRFLGVQNALRLLRDIYGAQCALQNEGLEDEKYVDVMRVGQHCGLKIIPKSQKKKKNSVK